MLLRAVWASVLLLALGVGSASAVVRISDDRGGQIGRYVDLFNSLRDSGETVMIDGPCLSACTLVVGFLPANRICVTPQALLGFHAAWHPDGNGGQITSDRGTQFLWAAYPPRVRSWIQRRGGLKRSMIFLRGRELAAMYAPCGQGV